MAPGCMVPMRCWQSRAIGGRVKRSPLATGIGTHIRTNVAGVRAVLAAEEADG